MWRQYLQALFILREWSYSTSTSFSQYLLVSLRCAYTYDKATWKAIASASSAYVWGFAEGRQEAEQVNHRGQPSCLIPGVRVEVSRTNALHAVVCHALVCHGDNWRCHQGAAFSNHTLHKWEWHPSASPLIRNIHLCRQRRWTNQYEVSVETSSCIVGCVWLPMDWSGTSYNPP